MKLIKLNRGNFESWVNKILEIERGSFATPWSYNSLREQMDIEFSHIWCLVRDEDLIGYICFWEVLDEVHLLNIAVSPFERNKGYASIMMAKLIEYSHEKGFKSVYLEVRPSNLSAIRLYEKFGFLKTGVRKNYYSESNEDAILMELRISAHKSFGIKKKGEAWDGCESCY